MGANASHTVVPELPELIMLSTPNTFTPVTVKEESTAVLEESMAVLEALTTVLEVLTFVLEASTTGQKRSMPKSKGLVVLNTGSRRNTVSYSNDSGKKRKRMEMQMPDEPANVHH